ncbi:MAG: Trk system potassium transporter TrkA [Clostridia bacterium]|nr:Trk system potassium transporter TrkA [Clostridia bacterium]
MRIVIVGLGKVGLELTEQLSGEGHAITVVDIDPRRVETALGMYDVAGVTGSAISRNVLSDANVEEADLVIAFTGNDELNLTCCLMSKKLGAKNTIARARKPEYNESIDLIRGDLGLSLCINPERETAAEIARILKFPLAKNIEPFAKGKIEMIEYVVKKDSPFCGRTVNAVFSKMRNPMLVCAAQRGEEVLIPYGDFLFAEGDVLMLVGSAVRMAAFFKELGIKTTTIRDVIIIGGGNTAYYLASQLIKTHIDVSIIEVDRTTAEMISEALPEATVILGDGTDHQLLAEEGLRDADALCCMTGIDEENIIASLYAGTVNPDIKTVTKINRSELTYLANPLGVGSVVTPKKIAANIILSYVRAMQNSSAADNVITLYKLANGKAEALEFAVREDSELAGKPLSQLPIENDVIVASINRRGKIISPRGSDTMEKGDTVIVVTTRSGLDQLDDILRR